MIVQQHAIACTQFASSAPFGIDAPTSKARHAAHAMIVGETQSVTFLGLQRQHRLGRGAEETIDAGGMVFAIHASHKAVTE
jgi:hypothetical protein